MKVYKIAKYRVRSDELLVVEDAMHQHAKYLRVNFPTTLWWTARDIKDPTQFMTLIISPDKETNERTSKSDGTKEFVDILYSKLEGAVEWTDWIPVALSNEL